MKNFIGILEFDDERNIHGVPKRLCTICVANVEELYIQHLGIHAVAKT